ncbi:MAG: hypothetical protein EBV06_09965 [Planctomycetia bacterium]|nr:hypothetical protein [Planctomycetia bacterium]
MFRYLSMFVAATLLSPLAVSAGGNDASFQQTITDIAEKVKEVCDQEGIKVLNGPEIKPAPGKPIGAPARIEIALSTKLKDLHIETKAVGLPADAQLTITVYPGEEPEPLAKEKRRPISTLRVIIEKSNGPKKIDKILDKDYTVTSISQVIEILGVTGNYHAPSIEKANNRVIEIITKKPTINIDGDTILDSKEFGIQLHREGKAIKPRDDNGLALVDLPKGPYTIVLVNRAAYEVAVDLYIDGLNVFSPPGQPQKQPGKILVRAGKSVEVPGWYVGIDDKQPFRAFEVGKLAPGDPRLESQLRGKLQTITATFHRCWPKGSEKPEDERGGTLGSDNEMGTTVGAPVSGVAEKVEREYGNPRGTVSIRYIVPKMP